MRKHCLFFLILWLLTINSFGENQALFNFKIDGTINADSGKISLIFFSAYMPNHTEKLESHVKNMKFSFSGYIPESQGVFIAFDQGHYISSNFVIDTGLQTISINIDSSRTIPKVRNQTMNEYPKWSTFSNKIGIKSEFLRQKFDSLQKTYNYRMPDDVRLSWNKEMEALYEEMDSTLLKFTEKNPKSKIAFWRLIGLMSWGYEPIFDSIYNSFSDTLKNGFAGKTLMERLSECKSLSVNQLFPDVNCVNTNNERFAPKIFLKNKLTLVDFWYSNCVPCRRQFPKMRDLYKQYGNKGFEIVGISVDKVEDINKWRNLIVEEKLVWNQYLDRDGLEAKKMSIYAYPTNFLIDDTGKIIAKNISMEELDELLNSTIK